MGNMIQKRLRFFRSNHQLEPHCNRPLPGFVLFAAGEFRGRGASGNEPSSRSRKPLHAGGGRREWP